MVKRIAALTVFFCFHAVRGTYAGEKLAILNEIAIQHIANREKIITWEGKVDVRDSYVRPNESQSAKCEVEYALNRAEDKYRWMFRQLESTLTVGGKLQADVRLYQVGGVRTQDGLTRLGSFDQGNSTGRQLLGVHAPDYFHTGPGSLDFDPMYYFQEGAGTLDSTFKQCYDMSEHKSPYRTTTQEGNLVTYRSAFNSVNQFTVDLAQGANLVEALYTESNPAGELMQETKVSTKYSRSGDIWVPMHVVYSSKRPQDGTEFVRTLNWTSQTINGDVADSAFSLSTIGARDGDVVSDMRSGLELAVKDGGLVPISAVPFQSPVPESRFIRWIVVFGTSLVLLLVLAVSFARQRRSAKQ